MVKITFVAGLIATCRAVNFAAFAPLHTPVANAAAEEEMPEIAAVHSELGRVCADEGNSSMCKCKGIESFGTPESYVVRLVKDSITCSAPAHGVDPAPGVAKTCWC